MSEQACDRHHTQRSAAGLLLIWTALAVALVLGTKAESQERQDLPVTTQVLDGCAME